MFLQSLCVTENGLITGRNATSTCLQFLGMLKPKPNPMFVVPSWQKCFDFWPFAFCVLRVCCHWQSQHRRRCTVTVGSNPQRSHSSYVGGWDWDVMMMLFWIDFWRWFLEKVVLTQILKLWEAVDRRWLCSEDGGARRLLGWWSTWLVRVLLENHQQFLAG